MIQSIAARLMSRMKKTSPGALTTRKRRVSASVTASSPRSCAADHVFSSIAQNHQNAKYAAARASQNVRFRYGALNFRISSPRTTSGCAQR